MKVHIKFPFFLLASIFDARLEAFPLESIAFSWVLNRSKQILAYWCGDCLISKQ
jgi:hypothetical protein